MGEYRYKAFISYSHKDGPAAAQLHKRLETYRVPKHVGDASPTSELPTDPVSQGNSRRTSPIFRDQDDLPVDGNLSLTIQDALNASETLIVLCSPASTNSRWVNEEIITFKRIARTRGETARIYPIILSGEPFASHLPLRDHEECLPKALRFKLGPDGHLSEDPIEPLAADFRGNRVERRLGFSKLVAGLLGVGLDEIVQRDLVRQRRRVMGVTAGALAGMVVMGTLTTFAVTARQEAETRRADAEGLIEFMLTDLKDTLEPVGRLDALQAVGAKASDYYAGYKLKDHDEDALGRRARVFHFLGETELSLGSTKTAADYFDRAYKTTEQLLSRDPNNPDRIFEQAQSAFWRATPSFRAKKYDVAEPLIQDYIRLADQLHSLESSTLRGLQEPGYARQNMGVLKFHSGRYEEALELFEDSYDFKSRAIEYSNDKDDARRVAFGAQAWIADTQLSLGNFDGAIALRRTAIEYFESRLKDDRLNRLNQSDLIDAYSGLARIYKAQGKTDSSIAADEIAVELSWNRSLSDPKNENWTRRLIETERLFIASLLDDGRVFDAEAHYLKTRPVLNDWLNRSELSEENREFYRYFFRYHETSIDILAGRMNQASQKVDQYLAEHLSAPVAASGNVRNLLGGNYVYFASLSAIFHKNPDIADTVLSEFRAADVHTSPRGQARYNRTLAAAEFSRGNPEKLDAYIASLGKGTQKAVFSALRQRLQ